MKYLGLIGLLIMTIGGILPFRTSLGDGEYQSFWIFPALGVLLVFVLQNGSLDNSRSVSGLIGLFAGIIATLSMIDTLSFPFAAVFSIGVGLPVFLFGVILACWGGFSKHQRVNTIIYRIGLFFIVSSFITAFLLGGVAVFFKPGFVDVSFSTYKSLSLIGTASLIGIGVGLLIVTEEFVRSFV